MELEDKDLSFNYRTHCDPRLNYEQSLGRLFAVEMSKSLLADPFFSLLHYPQTSRFCSPITSSQREEAKDRMISCFQVCVVEKITVKNNWAFMPEFFSLLPFFFFREECSQLGSTAKQNFLISSACYMSWSSIVYA